MADNNEVVRVAEFLKSLKPGNLPLPIFIEVARLTVTPIVEIVPLRKVSGIIEVLLIRREENDPVWPGLLHTPGTVIRASDIENDFGDSFKRILEGELHNTSTGKPKFVKNLLHKVKRGMESSQIYWVEVLGPPLVGQFYPVDSLPIEMVDTQKELIDIAVEDFVKNKI